MTTIEISHLSDRCQELYNTFLPVFPSPAQRALFVVFLENLDLHTEIVQSIKENGIMIEGSVGNMRINPALAERRKCDGQLMTLARQLGLEEDFRELFVPGSIENISFEYNNQLSSNENG